MTKITHKKLRAAVIGCGQMGQFQAQMIIEKGIQLVALCDPIGDQAQKAAQDFPGTLAYTSIEQLLEEQQLDIVNICSPHDSHAAITMMSAEAGVKGIYCEKPLSTNLADGQAALKACQQAGSLLVVNSQRRVGPDLLEAKRLIEQQALGEIRLLRSHCAGDLLSDGIHMIDSLMWLTGDAEIEWILGQVHGIDPSSTRYGHLIEQGAMAVIQIKGGPRLELFCGDLAEKNRIYQDYEIIGTKAQLWRTGDNHLPNLFIRDLQGGDWSAGKDDWVYKPIPDSSHSLHHWRPLLLENKEEREHAISIAYDLFIDSLLHGTPHPMSAEIGYRNLEVIMAIFESARLNKKIQLPLQQKLHPLEIMLEAVQN